MSGKRYYRNPRQQEKRALKAMRHAELQQRIKQEYERTFIVTETCPYCDSEVEMRWDTDKRGYKAYCPVCGNRLMLCDECLHSDDCRGCDYNSLTDKCYRSA